MEFDGPFHCTIAGDFHLGLKWRMLWLIIVNNGCISPFLKPITWQRMDLQETKWRKQVDIVVPRITVTKLNVLFAKKKKKFNKWLLLEVDQQSEIRHLLKPSPTFICMSYVVLYSLLWTIHYPQCTTICPAGFCFFDEHIFTGKLLYIIRVLRENIRFVTSKKFSSCLAKPYSHSFFIKLEF